MNHVNFILQVAELSRPSSLEVEEIIHQLAQKTLQRSFKDDFPSDYEGGLALSSHQDTDNELCDTICTSRDYLAKLLFWYVQLYFPLTLLLHLLW